MARYAGGSLPPFAETSVGAAREKKLTDCMFQFVTGGMASPSSSGGFIKQNSDSRSRAHAFWSIWFLCLSMTLPLDGRNIKEAEQDQGGR